MTHITRRLAEEQAGHAPLMEEVRLMEVQESLTSTLLSSPSLYPGIAVDKVEVRTTLDSISLGFSSVVQYSYSKYSKVLIL